MLGRAGAGTGVHGRARACWGVLGRAGGVLGRILYVYCILLHLYCILLYFIVLYSLILSYTLLSRLAARPARGSAGSRLGRLGNLHFSAPGPSPIPRRGHLP